MIKWEKQSASRVDGFVITVLKLLKLGNRYELHSHYPVILFILQIPVQIIDLTLLYGTEVIWCCKRYSWE